MTDAVPTLLLISVGFFFLAANSHQLAAWGNGSSGGPSAKLLVLWLGIGGAVVMARWRGI